MDTFAYTTCLLSGDLKQRTITWTGRGREGVKNRCHRKTFPHCGCGCHVTGKAAPAFLLLCPKLTSQPNRMFTFKLVALVRVQQQKTHVTVFAALTLTATWRHRRVFPARQPADEERPARLERRQHPHQLPRLVPAPEKRRLLRRGMCGCALAKMSRMFGGTGRLFCAYSWKS